MKILKKLLVSALMISASASAFAVSITYDYVTSPLRDDLIVGKSSYYFQPPLQGVDRIRASVTFSGALAEAILRGDEIFVKRDQTMSRVGEVVWSITNGRDTLTQDSAFDFDLRMGFKDGGPINGYLFASSAGVNDTWKNGDFSITANPNEPGLNGTAGTQYYNFRNVIDYPYQVAYAYGIGELTTTVNNNGVSAVPVPAALPLMASVLGLFGITRRRLALA